jgi:RNA polymerase-binding transcription factor DksA
MPRVNSIASSDHDALAGRLAASVERGEAQLRELESNLIGALRDHDTIQEDQDALRALVESIRIDVRQARRALDRIAEGTYGRCRECGEAIAPARLEAMPAAERCARCA